MLSAEDQNFTWAGLSTDEMGVESVKSIEILPDNKLLRWNVTRHLDLNDVYELKAQNGNIITLKAYSSVKANCFKAAGREFQQFSLRFTDNAERDEWFANLQNALHPAGFRRVRKLLVFVNPAGGSGRAWHLYVTCVLPIFEGAGIDIELVKTTHPGHAGEVVAAKNLEGFDGVVSVSGDGLLNEVVNGLCKNTDPAAIRVPIGVVPGGSGNAIAMSLADLAGEKCEAAGAALAIAKGSTHDMDMFTLSQEKTEWACMLSFEWGLVADIDIESEFLRMFGGARFALQGIIRMINLRRYTGRLVFLEAEEGSSPLSTSEPVEHSLAAEDVALTLTAAGEEDTWEARGAREKASQAIVDGLPEHLRALGQDGWRALEGEFVMLWAMNTKWGATDIKPTPMAELSDGCLDLLVLRDVSKLVVADTFLKMEDGSHMANWKPTEQKGMEYYKVRAFRLEPKEDEAGSYLVADGELIGKGLHASAGSRGPHPFQYAPVDCVVHPGKIRMFCSHKVTGAVKQSV